MIVSGKLFREETTEIEHWPNTFQSCSQEPHCSYSLKFFVVKNRLRNHSLSNCSLLGSCFCSTCLTCPSQRPKYTEGVAQKYSLNVLDDCTAVGCNGRAEGQVGFMQYDKRWHISQLKDTALNWDMQAIWREHINIAKLLTSVVQD